MNVHSTMIHWRIPGMLLATTDKALHHQFNVTLSRLDDQPAPVDGRLGIKEDQPLHSPDTMLSCIRGTTTATGLCVTGLLLYHDGKPCRASIAAVNGSTIPECFGRSILIPQSGSRRELCENAGDRLLPLGAR